MSLRLSLCGVSLALATIASAPCLAADFGFKPETELRKLESGNLKFLERISLGSSGNLRTYLERNRFRVVHELSDLACFNKQMGNLPAGCTVSVNVALGTRVSNLCTTLLRWNQSSKGASFQPLSGGALILISNPMSFVPSVRHSETRCMPSAR